MNHLLKPLQIDDPRILIEIITEVMDDIQSGAIVLDTSLGNNEFGYIDLIAADKNKTGIFFFINASGQEADFMRSFKCLQWYEENRETLQKLYTGIIDLTLPPCIFFISSHYSPAMQKVLLNLLKGYRVILLKYNCFQDGEKIKIFLERIADFLTINKMPDSKVDSHPTGANSNSNGTDSSGANSNGASPNGASPNGASPNGGSPNVTDNQPVEEQPDRLAIDLAKFRREIGLDISNISDEELLDLIE